MKKTFSILIIVIVLFAGCNNQGKQNKNGQPTITLREAWFPWAGYAGEVMAQYVTDSLYDINYLRREQYKKCERF
jgi:hypothetical protein